MGYLQRKIAEGEHQQQDFKYQISDSRKIARTLSAFANTDGGRLLIGVKDNGKINGVRSMEEVHMVEGAAEVFCTPEVEVDYHFHEEEGKQVVEALIQPSAKKPHFGMENNKSKVAYFRRKDQNFPANNVLIKYWKHPNKEPERIAFEEREKKLIAFLHDNPYITLRRFAHLTKLPFHKAEDLLATFMRWGIIAWDFNGRFFEYFLAEDHKDE
jgi:predicted HTH transcriptional regulator